MSKKRIVVLITILVLVVLGVFYLYQPEKVDWDNPDYVFNIEIPEDFDEYKIERVNAKIEEAKALFEQRHEDNWAWVVLGNLYEFVHDYGRAVYAYEKSLAMSPYDITSTLNLASIYEKQFADWEKAEYYYKKAIEIHSQNPDLYDRLAKFYYQKLNNYPLAEKVYVEGLQKVGEHPDLLTDIIRFYERADKPEPRIFYIKRLLELYPDNEIYQNEFGHLIK